MTPQPLADRGAQGSPELEALIAACLAKDPERRPQRARDLADALASLRAAVQRPGGHPRATPFAMTLDARGPGPEPAPPPSLTAREQEVLALASVLGDGFTERELALLDDAPSDLGEQLDRLIARGQLVEEEVSLRGRLSFAGAALREGAYRGLPRRRRRALHRRYAEALERQSAQRPERAYERLAHHYARGDEPRKAVHFGLLAARRALAEGRAGDAGAICAPLLELVEDPGWDGEPSAEEQLRALLAAAAVSSSGVLQRERGADPALAEELGDLLVLRGEYAQAREAYERARDDRRRITGEIPPEAQARHLLRTARLAQLIGRYDEALSECARGLALLEDREPALSASLEALAGLICCWAGRHEEARAWIERGRGRLGGEPGEPGPERLRVLAELHRAEGNLQLGLAEPRAAVEAFEAGLGLCERLDDAWERSIALFNLGDAWSQVGDAERAAALLDEAFKAKAELGDRWGLAYVYLVRARIHGRRGEAAPAIEAAEAGLKLATQIGDPRIAALLIEQLAELDALAKRPA